MKKKHPSQKPAFMRYLLNPEEYTYPPKKFNVYILL
jgi:hypothetical protein